MNKNVFTKKAQYSHESAINNSKNELISFVANQFKQLAKKHLRIPIQLYHL